MHEVLLRCLQTSAQTKYARMQWWSSIRNYRSVPPCEQRVTSGLPHKTPSSVPFLNGAIWHPGPSLTPFLQPTLPNLGWLHDCQQKIFPILSMGDWTQRIHWFHAVGQLGPPIWILARFRYIPLQRETVVWGFLYGVLHGLCITIGACRGAPTRSPTVVRAPILTGSLRWI